MQLSFRFQSYLNQNAIKIIRTQSSTHTQAQSKQIQTPSFKSQIPPFASHSEPHASAQSTLLLYLTGYFTKSYKYLSRKIPYRPSSWVRNIELKTSSSKFGTQLSSNSVYGIVPVSFSTTSCTMSRSLNQQDLSSFSPDFSKKYIIGPRSIQPIPYSATHYERDVPRYNCSKPKG